MLTHLKRQLKRTTTIATSVPLLDVHVYVRTYVRALTRYSYNLYLVLFLLSVRLFKIYKLAYATRMGPNMLSEFETLYFEIMPIPENYGYNILSE